MIESHDNTLIYIWADYCEASKSMFETNIKPYLEELEISIWICPFLS